MTANAVALSDGEGRTCTGTGTAIPAVITCTGFQKCRPWMSVGAAPSRFWIIHTPPHTASKPTHGTHRKHTPAVAMRAPPISHGSAALLLAPILELP